MKEIFVLLSATLCVVWVDGQLSEGDRCTTQNNQPGECVKISACITVLNDLRLKITNHAVCGYEGFTQIVCCPNAKPAVTIPTHQPISGRISARKCDEYSEFSFDKITISNTSAPPVEYKVSNCAFTSMEPLILGGTEAKIREFPHMALIGFEDDGNIFWGCIGALISEQFVVGAGHCSNPREYGPPKYVRLGEHDQSRADDGTTIDLRVIEIIPHPEYRYPIKYNDISLFKLERKVELSGAIRPACLPQVSAVPTEIAIASGWGTVSWKGKQNDVLQKAFVDVFSEKECNMTYAMERKLNRGIVEETQLCASSTCINGPLHIYHDSYRCSYIIVGVVSYGKACGKIGKPDVYTRVYGYLDWIEKIVWPDQ